MAWWLWMLLGFALIVCELTTPGGFFFLFFGLGAVAVGANLFWVIGLVLLLRVLRRTRTGA